MARHEMPASANREPEVVVTSITVRELSVRGRTVRERLGAVPGRRRAALAVALGLMLMALLTFIGSAGASHRTGRPAGVARGRLSDRERQAIAAELGYPYPLRCLTITISEASLDYARVHVNRGNGCGHYTGYLNASLHRVDGRWRLVLDEGQLFVPNRLLAP